MPAAVERQLGEIHINIAAVEFCKTVSRRPPYPSDSTASETPDPPPAYRLTLNAYRLTTHSPKQRGKTVPRRQLPDAPLHPRKDGSRLPLKARK